MTLKRVLVPPEPQTSRHSNAARLLNLRASPPTSYNIGAATPNASPDTLSLREDLELRNMADTAAEPLIRDTHDYEQHSEDGADVEEDIETLESALVSPGLFIWTLTLCAGISGLLFGYEYVSPP
jgi:hypothetical protein